MNDTEEDLGLTEEQLKAAREGFIPRERFNEETGKLKDRLAHLEGHVEALAQKPSGDPETKPKKHFNRAQLRAAVEAEQITQDEADTIWDQQQEEKFEERLNSVKSEFSEKLSATDSKQTVQSQIDRYADVLPDLNTDGSDARNKVLEEYKRLAGILGMPKPGTPEDLKLELAALQGAFGSVDKLKSRSKGSSERESMQDGVSLGDDKTKVPAKGALKGLSDGQKDYYQRAIDKGLYADWDAVQKELEFTRKKK